jgi:hypothetical protein
VSDGFDEADDLDLSDDELDPDLALLDLDEDLDEDLDDELGEELDQELDQELDRDLDPDAPLLGVTGDDWDEDAVSPDDDTER